VAGGDTLGTSQKVILNLLDIPPMKQKLEGVVMEIQGKNTRDHQHQR